MSGEIVTFYSYKGGSGRSMLLANVAWVLASNGRNVLAIDWDLEAPGLHKYFRPFLPDPDLTSWNGVIDFAIDFSFESASRGRAASASLLDYARSLEWDFEGGGSLDFVPAGRQDLSYGVRVNGFNWQIFYEQLGGAELLESTQAELRSNYDYILIDSRTGLSDTSGICTVRMPDKLVVCFTMNFQSLDGAASVAESVLSQRAQNVIRIYPVAMRVDGSEYERLERGRWEAWARFGPILTSQGLTREYLGEVEVPYQPFFAYEEVLAPFVEQPFSRSSILSATESLARYLSDGQIKGMAPIPEERRREARERFLARGK